MSFLLILNSSLNVSITKHKLEEPIWVLLRLLWVKDNRIFVVFLAWQYREVPCVLIKIPNHEHIIRLQQLFHHRVEISRERLHVKRVRVLAASLSRRDVRVRSLSRVKLFIARFGIAWMWRDVFHRVTRTQKSAWRLLVILSSPLFLYLPRLVKDELWPHHVDVLHAVRFSDHTLLVSHKEIDEDELTLKIIMSFHWELRDV